MLVPSTGMPACAHNSLAGISEKSLLPVRVHCRALDLLNSFIILTSILNRMRSLSSAKNISVYVCWACKPDIILHLCYIINVTEKLAMEGVLGKCYSLAEAINQRRVPVNNNACMHGGVSIFFQQALVWMILWVKCPYRSTCIHTQEPVNTKSR